MTDSQQPTAAAGWYPAPDRQAQLRYWDGAAWTDSYSPLPDAPTPAVAPVIDDAELTPAPDQPVVRKSGMGFMGKFLIGAAFVMTLAIGFGVANSIETSRTSPALSQTSEPDDPTSAPAAPAAPVKSAAEVMDENQALIGFKPAVSGELYYRAAEAGEYTCGRYACLAYAVVSIDGCPGGVYVEASVETAEGVSVGMANEITAGLLANQVAAVMLEDFEGQASRFRITDMHCMG